MLRRILIMATIIVAMSLSVRADNPKTIDAAAEKIDELIVRWEVQSKKVNSLSVKFRRVDRQAHVTTTNYEGQIWIRGPELLHASLTEVNHDKVDEQSRVKWVCDGKNLYQFLDKSKQVFAFVRHEEALRKTLDHPPLPFLFGVTAAKLRERYDLTILRDDAESYTLQLIPKTKIDQNEFSRAFVKLEKARMLPIAVRIHSPIDGATKTYTCTSADLVVNPELANSWFDAQWMIAEVERKGGWTVENPIDVQEIKWPWYGTKRSNR